MKDKIIKFGLIILSVFSIFIACFSSADNVSDLTSFISQGRVVVNPYSYITVIELSPDDYGTYCIKVNSLDNPLFFGFNSSLEYYETLSFQMYEDWGSFYACIYSNLKYIYFYNANSTSSTIDYSLFKLNALLNTQIPVLTSLECQTEYNLIPIEDVTENYCTSNFNLISPSDCPTSGGTGDVNWSSVWINNQQVVGSPNIFLNIYDRLDRSQTYVNQDMYIDVNGPEGDEDYINGIIAVNSYRPTSEDFTSAFVGGLTLILPYVVIALFIIFVRKLIRKIFK